MCQESEFDHHGNKISPSSTSWSTNKKLSMSIIMGRLEKAVSLSFPNEEECTKEKDTTPLTYHVEHNSTKNLWAVFQGKWHFIYTSLMKRVDSLIWCLILLSLMLTKPENSGPQIINNSSNKLRIQDSKSGISVSNSFSFP